MKYKITAVVDQDKEYSNVDQIKELSSDIQMCIADYNCFRIIEDVKAEEYRPNMREKVREYISELDEEIKRCEAECNKLSYDEVCVRVNRAELNIWHGRINALIEVKNDLKSRLEELV